MAWKRILALLLTLCLLAGCGAVVDDGEKKPRARLDVAAAPIAAQRVPTEPETEPTTEPTTEPPAEPETTPEPTGEETVSTVETEVQGQDYVLNKKSKKFHYPSCSSAGQIKDSNKELFCGTREELIGRGYEPCKRCYP